jgi:hypothetical protein
MLAACCLLLAACCLLLAATIIIYRHIEVTSKINGFHLIPSRKLQSDKGYNSILHY